MERGEREGEWGERETRREINSKDNLPRLTRSEYSRSLKMIR